MANHICIYSYYKYFKVYSCLFVIVAKLISKKWYFRLGYLGVNYFLFEQTTKSDRWTLKNWFVYLVVALNVSEQEMFLFDWHELYREYFQT